MTKDNFNFSDPLGIQAAEQRRNEKAGYALIGTVVTAVGVGFAFSVATALIVVGLGLIAAAIIR